MWALMGLFGGSTFGSLLSMTEGRKTLEKLRVGRVAVWGLLAGLAIPVLFDLVTGRLPGMSLRSFVLTAIIVAPLSAVSAGGMTALAQRASRNRLEGGDVPALPAGNGGQ